MPSPCHREFPVFVSSLAEIPSKLEQLAAKESNLTHPNNQCLAWNWVGVLDVPLLLLYRGIRDLAEGSNLYDLKPHRANVGLQNTK